MLTIDRQFLIEWLKPTFSSLAMFFVLFMLVDIFGVMDDLISHPPGFKLLARYLLYRGLFAVFFLLPVATLMGGFWEIRSARDSNEWISYLSAGQSPLTILRAPLAALVLMTLAAILFASTLLPTITTQMNNIREYRFNDSQPPERQFDNIHLQLADGRLVKIGTFLPAQGIIKDVVVSRKDDQKILKRWDARRGQYERGRGWELKDVEIRTFQSAGRLETRSTSNLSIPLEPPGVLHTVLRADPMRSDRHPAAYGVGELLTSISFKSRRGMNSRSEKIYLHWKVGFPLTLAVLGVLGFTLGIHTSLGRAQGIGLGLILVIVYWVTFNTCLQLGQNIFLPEPLSRATPIVAVYGPAILALLAQAWYWKHKGY